MPQRAFMSTRHPKHWRALLPRGCAWLWIVTVLAIGGTAQAQFPPAVGAVANLPQPDVAANAFSTSLRYDSSGNLYAWDGQSVWQQSGGTFNIIGSVTPGNQADAGPITVSQDGQTLLLSNGAGGYNFTGNGVFWTMPASGGSAAQVPGGGVPYAYDALALPAASTIPGSAAMYIVNAGNSAYTGSSLSIFDASTGTNQVVIDNGPGATTSIAINPTNNSLYVGVGYGTDAGNIYSFTLNQIDTAYDTGTPIDFLTGGKLFNPGGTGSQSGGGMFFDNNGYLFSGGDGITVFQPNGAISFDQPAGSADGYYDSLAYNPANNEVLKLPYGSSTGTLYNATDFEAAIWTNPNGGTWGSGGNWSGSPLTTVGILIFAGSTNGTAGVTLDGNRWASALQFGDSSAASSYAISAPSGGTLTLGTATGTSITVESGTNAISAPIVLAGSLAVNVAAGSSLQLGDILQAAGVAAALSLSGDGQLILSGTDDGYTGGTTVMGGTLLVTSPLALPDGSSLIVGSGAESIFGAARAEAPASVVPEPDAWALLAAAGMCLLAFGVRRLAFAFQNAEHRVD
jgi:autotransporter-associated beta strand protein